MKVNIDNDKELDNES